MKMSSVFGSLFFVELNSTLNLCLVSQPSAGSYDDVVPLCHRVSQVAQNLGIRMLDWWLLLHAGLDAGSI